MPLEAIRDTTVSLSLGETASFTEIDSDPIPNSWKHAAQTLLSEKRAKTVLILGGVDVGKTSFSIYLINSALRTGFNVAFVDSDLGQSDVGPPGTLSLANIRESVFDLFKIMPDDLIFIGVTTPSLATNSVVSGTAALKEKASRAGANFIVINTDGWIEGEEALNFKSELIKSVSPDYIILIGADEKLQARISNVCTAKIIQIDQPENIRKRDKEVRKFLRGLAYKKHLRNTKIRSFPLHWVILEGYNIYSGKARNASSSMTVLKNLVPENKDDISSPRSTRGTLVALKDYNGKVLGIGTVLEVDLRRNVIRIFTSVKDAVSRIAFGKVRLDRYGNEIGLI
ncbi:MAG: Clp1/GlmU family protein [Candidatus Bathyarchaeota archaeon]|nr:Clp1/GlmU family protein [Candidatus Bathyarchaeota archaeon]